MNSHHVYFAKPLLTYFPGETGPELHDRVRRIVSPSAVTFCSDRMFLARKAVLQLARAVLGGRIAGDTDQARVVIDRIAKGAMPPGTWLSVGAALDTCSGGGGSRNVFRPGREYLVFINGTHSNR